MSYRTIANKRRILCPLCHNPATVVPDPHEPTPRPKLTCADCGFEALGYYARTGPVFPR